MAGNEVKIDELPLITSLTDATMFPVDDATETYRATLSQVANYTSPKAYTYIKGFGLVDTWSSAVTYANTDFVFYNGEFYKSLLGTNLNQNPASATTYWRRFDYITANPQNMTDAEATARGHKRYLHGTSYNGGNAPTVSYNSGGGSLGAINLGVFIPYQMQDATAQWRLKGNLNVNTSSTPRTALILNINGITTPTGVQACAGFTNIGAVNPRTYFDSASNVIVWEHTSGSGTVYGASFDISLGTNKPTWAY